MGLLDGKAALIVGVANDHSLAWGIAQALHREGASLAFTYMNEAIEKRVRPLAQSVDAQVVAPCNVNNDDQIAALMEQLQQVYGKIDILVHSVAFARKDELSGSFLNTTRGGFLLALETSAYSLTALVKGAADLMPPGASVLTLTYHGAQQVVPNYNVMGVAKAALEASVRYLAADLGPHGIRVNAISAGPIRTLAASGIGGFRSLHQQFAAHAPLRRNVTAEDVGNTALWLCSHMASAITGEIIYADAGASIVGVAASSEQ
jgi:enoyl-[acyl-carrier protein] reductase I